MNNRYLIALLLAALALTAVGAGCGSSSKSKSTTISKADFLRKGNAVCSNGTKQINAAAKKIFAPKKKPTRQQVLKFAKTVLVPSVESQVNGIRALGAPKGDEAKVKAILDAADQGVAKAKQDPLALTKNNSAGPFKKANSLAKAYGLKACGG